MKKMILLFVLLPVLAFAQSPGKFWMQVDGGWLPPDNPVVLTLRHGVDCSKPELFAPTQLLAECRTYEMVPGCEGVNPYTEADRASQCVAKYREMFPDKPVIREFPLGAIFGRPYGEKKIIIIGRALGIDGVEIITAQMVFPVTDRGKIVAFKNDGGLDAAQWQVVQ